MILGDYEDGPNLVSMAMNGWGAAEPSWWLNLQADPQAVVELAGGSGARCSAGPQSAGSVNGCGSAGVNWTRTSTATQHDARERRRSLSSSRARRPNKPQGAREVLSRRHSTGGDPQIREGRAAGGLGQLYFDGKLVANTEIPVTTRSSSAFEGLTCGYDGGAAVAPTYTSPFTFTGTIHKVTVDISGDLFVDDDHRAAHYEAEGALLLARV